MKCVVIAGGYGERLWPLSRKNCPKQFIELEKNHSIFQDTIARNIPYCDEFVIVGNYEHRYIIENQLEPFQGLNYRCIYEKSPLKTTAAITLACLSIQPSELVFVVPANKVIDAVGYKESVLKAKKAAKTGAIVIFVKEEAASDPRYGYVTALNGDNVESYVEKPQNEIRDVFRNFGTLLFENGAYLQQLNPIYVDECKKAYTHREKIAGAEIYEAPDVHPIAIEKALLETCRSLKAVQIDFTYREIRTLEDLAGFGQQGVIVREGCNQTEVISTTNKAIVLDSVDHLLVVNTDDALYIGKNGKGMKQLLQKEELKPFSEKSRFFNRPWGSYEDLIEEQDYRVRRITIHPGKTIYEHKHQKRNENWTVIKGLARITIDGKPRNLTANDSAAALVGQSHQISNISDSPLILIESASGEILQDIVSVESKDLNETDLGMISEPIIKMRPALKDYLWGGNQLKEKYGIQTDMDIVAEAWELSAHPDGESIVSSGRHAGLRFSHYLERVGKNVLGWKCAPLQNFPLLIKFIDAKGNLSIQVHPDDDYALDCENQYGKNEMWYVIDSKPGAGLYVGFNRDVSPEEVSARVHENTITDILNFYPTKPGDIFFIPAGTVHAICEGNLICEIQQSSNCTYRLYDYDRKDKYGNTRPLHLKKAMDVLNFNRYEPVNGNVSCKYFEVEFIDVNAEKQIAVSDDRFISVVCLDGTGTMEIGGYLLNAVPGDCFFVPAQEGILKIKGKLKIAKVHV